MEGGSAGRASSVRWKILRQALLSRQNDVESQLGINKISRKAFSGGFKLVPFHLVDPGARTHDVFDAPSTGKVPDSANHVFFCYSVPIDGSPKLFLMQRLENRGNLRDFEICNQFNIDNTGLVCLWPSEEVLAYYCLSIAENFRSKRVIELGSGYGLAGLVIAAATEASEVIITDGNPQVVDYIQQSIEANSKAFGCTKVKSMMLHWNQTKVLSSLGTFEIIVASDCTFFKEFHAELAQTVRLLLRGDKLSEALFLSPKRGDSLDKFLEAARQQGLNYSIIENYNDKVWKRHRDLLTGDDSWPSYNQDQCYPLLIRITK